VLSVVETPPLALGIDVRLPGADSRIVGLQSRDAHGLLDTPVEATKMLSQNDGQPKTTARSFSALRKGFPEFPRIHL
jgi:hypothetical protein